MDTNFTLTTIQANVPLYSLIGLTVIFLVCCLFAKLELFANKRISISLSALITIVTCQFVHYSMNLSIDKSFVWYVKICYKYFLIFQLLLGIICLTNYFFVSFCGININSTKLLKIVSTFLSLSLFLYGALGYFIQFIHIYENESYLETNIQNHLILYLVFIFIGSYGITSFLTNSDKNEQDTAQSDPYTSIEPKSTLVKISYTWKIENFSMCDVLNEEGYIESKALGDDKNIKFIIRLYPDNNGQVSIYLKFVSDVCKTLIVRWECIIKKRYGSGYKNLRFVMTADSLVGWKDFANRRDIIGENSQYSRVVDNDGSLTITFEICYDESSFLNSKVEPSSDTEKNENKENTTQPTEK